MMTRVVEVSTKQEYNIFTFENSPQRITFLSQHSSIIHHIKFDNISVGDSTWFVLLVNVLLSLRSNLLVLSLQYGPPPCGQGHQEAARN